VEDRVRCGAIAPRVGADRQSLNCQRHWRHVGRGESYAGAVEALGVDLRRIELAGDVRACESEP
jgi:hypothetical protein